ncbi:MAG: hypothetical protein LBM62_09665 [Mediterranea sp.]|jgi:hypothetical protein|nr:hypothetical protein [Mediterranea sp.]
MSKSLLSSHYNTTLGFIPIVITFLLCRWFSEEIATYIGTAVGIVYCIYALIRPHSIVRLLLYSTTVILLLFSLFVSHITNTYFLEYYYLLFMEIVVLIPPAVLLILNNRFNEAHRRNNPDNQNDPDSLNDYDDQSDYDSLSDPVSKKEDRQFNLMRSALAAIVSARIALILGIIHLLIVGITLLVSYPPSSHTMYWLFRFSPFAVFVLSILLNQLAIGFFNYLMNRFPSITVVNEEGDVIGKTSGMNIVTEKPDCIIAYIRIALVCNNMFYLGPQVHYAEENKIDLTIGDYVSYGKGLEESATRLAEKCTRHKLDVKYVCKYRFETDEANQLNYLFWINIDDENLIDKTYRPEARLWTMYQIEQSLGKGFFSRSFEIEYEILKKELLNIPNEE